MSSPRPLPGRSAHPYVRSAYPHQLEMIRPTTNRVVVPPLPCGYKLRHFRPNDTNAYEELFRLAWEEEGVLSGTLAAALDDGFFVVEDLASGALVASCVAEHITHHRRHSESGRLGWLVTDPSHTGKGLGTITAASVTNRLVAAGYRRPFLGTEDLRLVAISIYLKLGWQPHIYRVGMEARWQHVFRRLGLVFEQGVG